MLFHTGFTAKIKYALCHLWLHQDFFFSCAREKGDKGAVGDKGEGVFTDS